MAPARYPAPTMSTTTIRWLRRRSTRIESAAATPPTTQKNRVGESWNTGCRPMTTDRIIAAIIETRPLKRTVSIIAVNGRGTSTGCCGTQRAITAAPTIAAANRLPTSATWRGSR